MTRLGTTLLMALSLSLSLAASPLAAAQNQGGAPPSRPAGGGPGGPPAGGAGGAGGAGVGGAGVGGAGRGDRIFDVTETVARVMEADLDKDGKLSKSEAPAPFATRGFERADSNADGFVDRAELTVFFSSQNQSPPEGRGEGRGAGRGAAQQSFGGGMKQAGRAWNALKKSSFDAASKQTDLEQVQALQSGLLASKGQLASVKMSDAAKAKFGDDQAAYALAFRRQLLKTLGESVALELALLDGDAAAARAAMGRLDKEQDAGHELFAAEE